jgi:hypothetical protein
VCRWALGDDDRYVDPFSEAPRSPVGLCAGLAALAPSFAAVLAGVVLAGGAVLTRFHGRIELARGRERHLAEPSLNTFLPPSDRAQGAIDEQTHNNLSS